MEHTVQCRVELQVCTHESGLALVAGDGISTEHLDRASHGANLIPLPGLSETTPLNAYDAAYQEATSSGWQGGARLAWQEALEALCDWAWDAGTGPVLRWLARRQASRPSEAGGVPRVVLVPVGSAGRWRYAIEDAVFTYAASGAQFDRASRRPAGPWAAAPLLVSDPTNELPAAQLEVAELRRRYYPDAVFLGLPADLATGTARGQYSAGWQGGRQVGGFLEEDGIPSDSRTETYAALRLGVDTRRWAGVPFYLRAGKRLPRRMTEIALIFQRAPHLPFAATDTEELGQNALVIRIQPDEGITVRFGSKVPGTAMEVRDVNMDFAYGESFTEASPEAYERLILDVLIGDPPLFPRQEEVELSWRILDPIEQFWAENTKPEQYASGSEGPASADAMMARDGRAWRRL